MWVEQFYINFSGLTCTGTEIRGMGSGWVANLDSIVEDRDCDSGAMFDGEGNRKRSSAKFVL